MKNIPSDYELLTEIYKRHKQDFESYSKQMPNRSTKIYVPIDIEKIAEYYEIDPEIIFGRLNSYFNEEYGYKNDDGSLRPFFSKVVGGDKNAINYPQLATVIAKM